ncbi:MAG: hypothetical protein CM15mV99_280 [Caudoviricetes sp.]|nr:MAG: hypothetical protein CM15mV99_280 [Caudoviricetes sp.]
MASHKERRKNLRQSVRELEANRNQIPINDRINAQLKKDLILSSNGKQIIRNNQNRRSGMGGSVPNAIGSGIIGGGFPLLLDKELLLQ